MTRINRTGRRFSETLRNWITGGRTPRSSRQARRRLLFEPLENRQLLAAGTDLAAIMGIVFDDFTGDGFSPGEEVAGATVNLYADTNGNSTFEPGAGDTLQTSTTTNASGQYRFSNLTAGSYFVQQPAQTLPGATLLADNSNVIVISATDVQGTVTRTIDTFNTTTQSVTDTTNNGVPVTNVAAASEAIGGERDLRVNLTTSTGVLQLQANAPVSPGVLRIDTSGPAAGQQVVTWDGVDGNATSVDDAGLGGIDLTSAGTATGFNLTIGADLAGGTLTLRVYSDDGVGGTASRFSTTTIAMPATGGPATAMEYIPFTSLTPSGGGADFTSVGAIEIEFAGVGELNAKLDLVTVVGPTLFTQNFANFESADLSLTKTVSNASPNVGENVTFTLTLANAGPDSASNVAVGDTLPTGMTFVSSTPSQGTYNSGTGVWTVGALASGGNATLQIVASVTSSGAKTNTAEVTVADQFDPDSTPNNGVALEDDQGEASLTTPIADLSLTKTVDNPSPNIGQNVTFTLTLANAGPDGATGVSVGDSLPAGMTFVSSTPSQGAYNSGTGVWTVGSVASGGTATLQIVASVDAGGSVTNTAQVTASDQADPDSTPNNNVALEDDQSSAGFTAATADLSLTKTVDNASPNVGDNITFTLTAANAGPDSATNVAVADLLPAGL
ncbi:MAG: SpaA isopeptide-forming pilin-related protein, partial [Planctomycetota bacterium]